MQIAALFFVVVFVFHLATEVFTKYKILLDNSTKKKKTREEKVEVFNTGCTPPGRA